MVHRRSAACAGASRKGVVLQPHIDMVLKDSGEEKSSQWAEHLAIYFVWKEKRPELRTNRD